jgi:hypothetical protein
VPNQSDLTLGRRSLIRPRNGTARPLRMSIPIITRKGTPLGAPVTLTYFSENASRIPISSPPTSVIGNDANPPTSAAVRAGTTVSTKSSGDILLLTTALKIIPARADKAHPSAQLPAAMRLVDQPRVAVAVSFSATPVVASPKRDHR